MGSFSSNPPARSVPAGGGGASGGGTSSNEGSSSFNSFSNANTRGLAGPDEVNRFHEAADTDRDYGSAHHTLGPSPNQASPGNHSHDGKQSKLLVVSNLPTGYSFDKLADKPRKARVYNGTSNIVVGTSTTPVAVALLSPDFTVRAGADVEIEAQWNSWNSTVAGDRATFSLRYSINSGSVYNALPEVATILSKVDAANNAQQGGLIIGSLIAPGAGTTYRFGLFCERTAGTGSLTVNFPIKIKVKEVL